MKWRVEELGAWERFSLIRRFEDIAVSVGGSFSELAYIAAFSIDCRAIASTTTTLFRVNRGKRNFTYSGNVRSYMVAI